ncbi:hypothetical protein B0H14DRAFT_2649773 [Mycena olivaceomarginata]|nr:hypothetical protein B0H14DRAFT_2649773 [Mycena olivaceomarginata]
MSGFQQASAPIFGQKCQEIASGLDFAQACGPKLKFCQDFDHAWTPKSQNLSGITSGLPTYYPRTCRAWPNDSDPATFVCGGSTLQFDGGHLCIFLFYHHHPDALRQPRRVPHVWNGLYQSQHPGHCHLLGPSASVLPAQIVSLCTKFLLLVLNNQCVKQELVRAVQLPLHIPHFPEVQTELAMTQQSPEDDNPRDPSNDEFPVEPNDMLMAPSPLPRFVPSTANGKHH